VVVDSHWITIEVWQGDSTCQPYIMLDLSSITKWFPGCTGKVCRSPPPHQTSYFVV
jgi:hypothetical protein